MSEARKSQPRRHGDPFAESEKAGNVLGTVRRLAAYFAGEKMLVAGLVAVVTAAALLGLAAPVIQSRAIDVIAGERTDDLLTLILLFAGLSAAAAAGHYFQGIICARLSQNLITRLRCELFGRIMALPVPFLDRHPRGDLMSRMSNDIENISSTVSMSLPTLISGVLTLGGTVLMMFWFCWQLAALSCLTLFATVGITSVLSRYVRRYSRMRQAELGTLNAGVEETLSAFRTVRALNLGRASQAALSETSARLTAANIRAETVSGIFGPLMNAVNNASFVVIAVFGAWFALKGIITVGVIAAFLVYARQFGRPVNEIAMVWGQLQTAVAGAERVFAVLDRPSEDTEGEAFGRPEDTTVDFDHVTFGYDPAHPVIHDLSLTIPSGQKVALVGKTGSGKTTLSNLILRFYDPDTGVIRIGGRDLSGISRQSVRQAAAVVLQDTALFTGTIRENLCYANPDATDEELLRAADMSCCRDLIDMVPGGLDAEIGRDGFELSAGEKQLLAIARAFVADPKILILDEATSNVDTRTERRIQQAMQALMKNRTSIVIAHRLSTVRDSDLIVVLNGGRIAEQGTHESLLAAGGEYAALVHSQDEGMSI